MQIRVVARLAAASGLAVGALALAYQLAQPAPGSVVDAASAANGVAAAPAGATTSATGLRGTGVRHALEATAAGAARTATAALPGSAAAAPAPQPVDESRPHQHVVDPETGGLVAVAGADAVLPAAGRLGPLHVDPLPAGVHLSDPVDTASLLARADLLDGPDLAPRVAASTVPPGPAGVASLASHVEPSCSGTGIDGKRVQVLYVHESSTVSRYAKVLPLIRNEVANVDDVFAVSSDQTGGGRRVRWVTDASCVPVVADVTVPVGALGPKFFDTIAALKAKGYQSRDRKYVVFADANQFCGIGTLYSDDQPSGNLNDGYAASYARIDANCWATNHSVAAHELTHNLGGVQTGAPHVTTNGHCWDEADLMCYDDGSGIPMRQVCAAAQEQLLDCRHDDYFSTDPAPGNYLATHWNTASSSFLDTVAPLSGTPRVSVGSSVAAARTGESVTLTATSTRPVTWAWSTPSACVLTPVAPGTVSMVCPAAVTGPVPVTAAGTDPETGETGRGTTTVSLTRAAAPTAVVTAPGTGVLDEGFAVSVAPTGSAPFRYSWAAGPCSPADPRAGATTITCPAGVTSQFLAVTATVTQADGQTATGTSYVAVGDTEHPAPPRTTTAWTAPASAQGRLTSTLRAAGGVAVAGQPLVLEVQWYGTTGWVPLATLTTDGTGTASTSAAVPRAGSFRFAWSGDATRAGSTSPATYLKVPTKVTGTSGRTSVAATLQTVAGTRLGGAPLTLQKRVTGTTRWITVSTLRTTTRGTVAATVRPRRTTYYRWVFAGEAQHVSALSAQVVVRR